MWLVGCNFALRKFSVSNPLNNNIMKKVFLLLCLLATTTIATATDLWEGTHAVDWSNTLTIEAAKFADAQVGQKIVVEFKDATGEVIELHSNGGMLPGTRYAHFLYADQHEMEVFITPGMLACLIDGINWSDYKAIRFYSEANRTDYVINVLTKWGDDGKLGDQTTMTMTNEYAELSLEGIDMAARLDTDRLMVQCNKEGGNPFNFTAIVLVKKEVETGVRDLTARHTSTASKNFNLAGQRVVNPGKGFYIVDGRKCFFK